MKIDYTAQITDELKMLRKKHKLTQHQLAAIISSTQKSISRWESGKEKLNKIKYLGIKAILESSQVEGSRND